MPKTVPCFKTVTVAPATIELIAKTNSTTIIDQLPESAKEKLTNWSGTSVLDDNGYADTTSQVMKEYFDSIADAQEEAQAELPESTEEVMDAEEEEEWDALMDEILEQDAEMALEELEQAEADNETAKSVCAIYPDSGCTLCTTQVDLDVTGTVKETIGVSKMGDVFKDYVQKDDVDSVSKFLQCSLMLSKTGMNYIQNAIGFASDNGLVDMYDKLVGVAGKNNIPDFMPKTLDLTKNMPKEAKYLDKFDSFLTETGTDPKDLTSSRTLSGGMESLDYKKLQKASTGGLGFLNRQFGGSQATMINRALHYAK